MQILPGHYEKHQGTEEFRVKLIMCVSKNGGISFNNRRQSCDDCKTLSDQYYFAEKEMPQVDDKSVSEVVLYHWNREYPADHFFDMDLKGFRLKETVEFSGKSHECVRREIWVR
jgi:excinuclease UvrABC ATPase subunit